MTSQTPPAIAAPACAPAAATARTSSAAWLRGVVEMFEAEGVAVAPLLRDAGFDARRLSQPEARFPADDISVLWRLAVARSGKPTLGLDRALAARHANLDTLGHAIVCSPTLREGLRRLARYLAVVSDAATFAVAPQSRPPPGTWLVLGHIGSRRPVPRQRIEYGMLSMVTACEWLLRRRLQPLAVEFTDPPPDDDGPHRAAFGCAPRFGAEANRVLLADADLDEPIPTRHPGLAALHDRLLDERLADLGATGIAAQVCAEIARRLGGGEPRRQDVARGLGLAERTLQRRLQAEQVSFQALLERTRRELAAQHLADARATLAEVADRLGFVDASNFFRACRRWFGMSPAQYRERLAREGAPPPVPH